MSDQIDFSATPMFRMTATYEEDLDRINSPQFEEKLLEQIGQRFGEATVRRDNIVRALFILDFVLAVLVSGKNLKIPGTEISTQDLPAVMEIVTGLSSFAICTASMSFATWLCYSQLLWALTQRTARKIDIEGAILRDFDHFNELSVRLFQRRIAIAGEELFSPKFLFNAVLLVHDICTKILFGIIPLMHILLVGYAVTLVIERSGFTVLHSLLYAAVVVGHVLALIFWFAPNATFGFRLRTSPFSRGDRPAER